MAEEHIELLKLDIANRYIVKGKRTLEDIGNTIDIKFDNIK